MLADYRAKHPAELNPDDPDAEREPEEHGPRPSVAESLPAFLARVRSLPEPSWFIRDLMPDEGVVVWHGRPRPMKSLTAEAAMLSLALGESCALGNPRFAIKAPVGVLWLGEEDSERLDAFRFNLLRAGPACVEEGRVQVKVGNRPFDRGAPQLLDLLSEDLRHPADRRARDPFPHERLAQAGHVASRRAAAALDTLEYGDDIGDSSLAPIGVVPPARREGSMTACVITAVSLEGQ